MISAGTLIAVASRLNAFSRSSTTLPVTSLLNVRCLNFSIIAAGTFSGMGKAADAVPGLRIARVPMSMSSAMNGSGASLYSGLAGNVTSAGTIRNPFMTVRESNIATM
jgi:hypothetical protein